jgi:S-DNA-T family DNA segregation ATPase FtsK/SpoIIIE
LLEFQVASITKEDPPYNFIREFSKKLSEKYSGRGAISVPVLPEEVTEAFLSPHAQQGALNRVPIGVEKATLAIACYNFSANVVNLILSLNQEWQEFTNALAAFIASCCGVKTIILAPTGKTPQSSAQTLQVFNDTDSCVKAASELYNTVLTRNNEYKDRLAEGGAIPVFEPIIVIIQSMSLLKTMLERYKPTDDEIKEADDDTPFNRLQTAMWKSDKAYNVHFIVAESLNSLTPFTVENWYKAHIDGNNGLWVGSGISTQYRLNVSKKPQDYSSELESDFGFVVTGATATLVKLLQ